MGLRQDEPMAAPDQRSTQRSSSLIRTMKAFTTAGVLLNDAARWRGVHPNASSRAFRSAPA